MTGLPQYVKDDVVAEAFGIGTHYEVVARGKHPDCTRFDVYASSGGARHRLLQADASWTDAMDLVRDTVAHELTTEGATAAVVG